MSVADPLASLDLFDPYEGTQRHVERLETYCRELKRAAAPLAHRLAALNDAARDGREAACLRQECRALCRDAHNVGRLARRLRRIGGASPYPVSPSL